MTQDERNELITAISLRAKYALSYLESLSDEELESLYGRLSSEGYV